MKSRRTLGEKGGNKGNHMSMTGCPRINSNLSIIGCARINSNLSTNGCPRKNSNLYIYKGVPNNPTLILLGPKGCPQEIT